MAQHLQQIPAFIWLMLIAGLSLTIIGIKGAYNERNKNKS